MALSTHAKAWNNFVSCSQPDHHEAGSSKRFAAMACLYMGTAANGGISTFLTSTPELDAAEVLEALASVGAPLAAREFSHVLNELGVPLPPASQEARFGLIERHWPEALDEHDFLSDEAYEELEHALQWHVHQHEAFYLALNTADDSDDLGEPPPWLLHPPAQIH